MALTSEAMVAKFQKYRGEHLQVKNRLETLSGEMNICISRVRDRFDRLGASWQNRYNLVQAILATGPRAVVWKTLTVPDRKFVNKIIANLNIGYTEQMRADPELVPEVFTTCNHFALKCQGLFDVVARDEWTATLLRLSDYMRFLNSVLAVCRRFVDAVRLFMKSCEGAGAPPLTGGAAARGDRGDPDDAAPPGRAGAPPSAGDAAAGGNLADPDDAAPAGPAGAPPSAGGAAAGGLADGPAAAPPPAGESSVGAPAGPAGSAPSEGGAPPAGESTDGAATATS